MYSHSESGQRGWGSAIAGRGGGMCASIDVCKRVYAEDSAHNLCEYWGGNEGAEVDQCQAEKLSYALNFIQ